MNNLVKAAKLLDEIEQIKQQLVNFGKNIEVPKEFSQICKQLNGVVTYLEEEVKNTNYEGNDGSLRDIYEVLKKDSIILVTDEKGFITYVNRKCCQVVGYTRQELIGEHTRIFNSGYHGKDFYKNLWKTILSGEVWKGEMNIKRKNGSSIWNFISIFPILDQKQRPLKFLTLRTDITEKKIMELKLMQTEKQMHSIIENSKLMIGIFDVSGTLTFVNHSVEKILGYRLSEVIGSPIFNYILEEDIIRVQSGLKNILNQTGNSFRFELKIKHKNGYLVWCEISATNHLKDRFINGVVFNLRDITEQKKIDEKTHYMAYFDYLTDLPNRRHFEVLFEQELLIAQEKESQFAMMVLDLDGFTHVNNSLGHKIGDLLLKEVSNKMKQNFGDTAIIGRLSGDEFALLLPNVGEFELIEKATNQLLTSIGNHPFKIGGYEFFITASVGVSVYPYSGKSMQQLFKHANSALYSAKYNGKNQYQIFSPSMNLASDKKFMLKNDLQKAVMNDELIIHYQPRFDPITYEVTGAEALIRWNHPELGMISPLEFIPIAEETGLIIQIGEWLIREVCTKSKMWQRQLITPVKISINLSAIQLFQSNFVEKVLTMLRGTELEAKWIEFEITESVIIDKEEQVLKTLTQIKELGISIALDDFGTGYSAINYLRQIPCDIIKIDKSLVKDMQIEVTNFEIVAAIVALCHKLNKTVVAEGVETPQQLLSLQKIECDEIQGYLFSKPVEETEFVEIIKNKKWINKIVKND
ncbi:hypothetical protein BKP45_13835 [Anaerobacillus alkalidiazotrophicus]|uniref:PAS domain S-box protein n=1 Tax=Anaerobacillus alkalidiazotrophicus TaxID=472963 RepID=A0A1S2M3L7_9BACI|nr:bifunctional diguanylate cyclase/phosphodiesterase [Anaerobacillus alkalidiazotrophicus]OIJ19234.1 hypothetical protein BKP45_13835 [Anaerobacillus alkalidiazotrophicus]